MPISLPLPSRPLRARLRCSRWHSLRQRLLVGIGLPLLLLQIGVFWVEYRLDRREELTQMRRELTTLTRLSAARLDAELARLPGDAADPARLGNDHLQQLLREADFQPGELLLVSATGTLLASDDRPIPPGLSLTRIARRTGDPAVAALARAIAHHRTGVVRLPRSLEDRQVRWALFTPVRHSGGAVLALVPESAILAQTHLRLLRQSSVFVLGSLLILVWLAFLTTLVTRPLARLARATRAVAAGDESLRIAGPFPRDEVGRLMRLFNRMLGRLQSSRARERHAIAARERVESELSLALRIQQSLLPPAFADDPHLAIATAYEPARFVAGDFYDYFRLDDRTLVLAIADVSGKGISAALFMAAASTSLRNFSQTEAGPAATLTRLNRDLQRRNRESLFLTLFLAWLDLPSGHVIYANAGHNSPYRFGPGLPVQDLGEPTGPLLAVLEGATYGEKHLDLAPGERLLLFTDGLVEAADAEGDLFGEARLEAVLRQCGDRPPQQLLPELRSQLQAHCHGPAQDDLTLLLVTRPSGAVPLPGPPP